jgi:nucleotide-binding universal stress UspA family protein
MFKNILIATDGSETSQMAARMGVELAKNHGSKVVAVYVADTSRLGYIPDYIQYSGMIRELMLNEGKDATDYVEELAKNAELSYEKIILEGKPSDELLKITKESEVDLLVMGSVGRGGLDRFLLGSVAEKVVQHSKVPIMLVPGGKHIDNKR